MKTCLKKSLVLPVLVAALAGESAGLGFAQTFKALATRVQLGSLSGNTIYGFNPISGSSGTIVTLNIDGTGLRTLYAFTPTTVLSPGPGRANSDGAGPSGLTLSGSTLYGSCSGGGFSGNGTLFRLNTDGTGFTVLYTFADRNSDGYFPSPLILSGGTLYGITKGGASGNGTLFSIGIDGTGFTTLYSFSARDPSLPHNNSDGSDPYGPLALSGNTLYGLAQSGGTWGNGTVFAVNTDGRGFATLHSFPALAPGPVGFCSSTNSDGAIPSTGMILSSNTLHGTAYFGGGFGNGTVFAMKTDGTGFTVLHNFSSYVNCSSYINADGGNPVGSLALSGNTLCGTTVNGGSSGYAHGVVFAVNTDGTGFTNLHSFDGPIGAAGQLVVSGNNLYGGTYTLFSIALPIVQPQLSIVPAGANVVLSWPANIAGFSVQSTTDLTSSFWTTNFAAPVVVNGQYTVTNPISGTRQFFRLSQ